MRQWPLQQTSFWLLQAVLACLLCAGHAHRQLLDEQHPIAKRPKSCAPYEVHIALGDDETSMLVQWATTLAGCSGDVTFSEAAAWLAETNTTLKATASAEHHKLSQDDMCSAPAASKHFSLHMHVARLSPLRSGTRYTYQLPGSHTTYTFTTAPRPNPDSEITFVAFGDMGHPWKHKCPGARATLEAVISDRDRGRADLVLHVGDLSYADGQPQHWEAFMDAIAPLASSTPYMVAVGNHEYDYITGWERDPSGSRPYRPDWGNFGLDSGGECGATTAGRFRMPHHYRPPTLPSAATPGPTRRLLQPRPQPTPGPTATTPDPFNSTHPKARAPFWYSFDYGPVHFAVISTEHELGSGSPQHRWLAHDLQGVDRGRTPWVVVALHRPLYVVYPHKDNRVVGGHLRERLEHLLRTYQVDLTLAGHVHSYSRTCAVFGGDCVGRQGGGITHFIVGTGGHQLSGASGDQEDWFESTLVEYGYLRVEVKGSKELVAEFVRSSDGKVKDRVVLEGFEGGSRVVGPAE